MTEPDFSGWATKANLKCSDGRTIMKDAFAHMDGIEVPLVWQHRHGEVENVLGHARFTAKEEGLWADGFFNNTPAAQHAKEAVSNRDVTSLSIFANDLIEKAKQVFHGTVRELSLVLSGANPGAKIVNWQIAHSDGDFEVLADEAVIYTGLELVHSEDGAPGSEPDKVDEVDKDQKGDDDEGQTAQEVYDTLNEEQKAVVHSMIGAALEVSADAGADTVVHAVGENATIQDVYNSFTEDQKNVVHYMIGAAIEAAEASSSASHSGITGEGDLTHQEGNNTMSRNVFDQNKSGSTTLIHSSTGEELPGTLSHDTLKAIQADAQKGGSYKEAFLAHAESLGYGIDDIELLFPDAKSVTSQPDLIARRTEWVAKVLDGAKHSPFSRVKSIHADLTAEEARAKGYVKGALKKEEVIKLLKRVTTPTTVYKKQKLDRDDIIDITELDVVVWLKWEMRFMLEEEIARAILIGDGREPDDEDKIDEDHLRPIAWDHEMYAHPVNMPANVVADDYVEYILRARKHYKGTGTPTLFTTDDILTDMLLLKDKIGRRLYNTEAELGAAVRVANIVVVEVMEDVPDLIGILVNMADYTIGADKGGQLAMFDDFDIDYNQQKYLMETRISGALTKAKSAVVLKRTSGTTVTPQVPAFNSETNTITVPSQTGVDYFDVTNPLSEVALTDGASVVIDETTDVEARPTAGYNFPHNTDADWTYAYSE
jgi:hypothetical protein